jgi:hypothetical protein
VPYAGGEPNAARHVFVTPCIRKPVGSGDQMSPGAPVRRPGPLGVTGLRCEAAQPVSAS